ncbi:MAG: M48 family metalloprotease, partial [Proteobacteria bacterium]|nr:M48 family metalloprotease [Pseudomonadota bacterium]
LSYLRDIGAKVQGYSPISAQVPVNFYLVQNDEINAFAIPGGNIYVHTGLIYAAEDEAELASVIAHEYGHVVYRHSAQHLSRANMAGLAQSVLLGEDGAQSAKIEAGQVWLPERAPWLDEFKTEILQFPNGRHDDQVDSMSQFLGWLDRRNRGTIRMIELTGY